MMVGWLGTLYERMTPAAFWLLHAGLVAAGGGLLLVAALVFRGILAPEADPELATNDAPALGASAPA